MRIRERMATVTTDATTPTTLPIAAPSHARMPSATCWMRAPTTDGSDRASSCVRSSVTPDRIELTMSTSVGDEGQRDDQQDDHAEQEEQERRKGRGLRLRPSAGAEAADQRRERGRHDQREQDRDRDRPEQDGQPDRDGGQARDGEQAPAECAEAAQPPRDDDRVSWDGCRHDTPSTHRSGWIIASPAIAGLDRLGLHDGRIDPAFTCPRHERAPAP